MKEALKNFIPILLPLLKGEISKKNLKYVTTSFASKNFHYGYEYIIKKYDPEISFKITTNASKKVFVGKGFGKNSLNSYRKIYSGNIKYFEKIYFTNSPDLNNAIESANKLKGKNTRIKSPELFHIQKGKKISILYYEYLKFKINQTEETFMKAVYNTQHDLIKIEKNEAKNFDIVEKIKNVQYLKQGIHLIKQSKILQPEILVSFVKLLKKKSEMLRSYQHMDLCNRNVGLNNIILDWDTSGEYIFGIDVAFAITELSISYKSYIDRKTIDKYIELFYPFVSEKCSYNELKYLIYFLYLIIKLQRCSSKKMKLSYNDKIIANHLNTSNFDYV